MAFIDDIQSRDTVIFPIIEFDVFPDSKFRISTQPITLENNYYNPLLLSSPKIRESVDLQNRKYKISTVSLSISNVEVSGIRFSDNNIPINSNVYLYWVSPSCESLQDCYLAFTGIISKTSHNEKTYNITLEDKSQSTLHKNVPIAMTGTGNEIPEKYKNKPIPMVYGTVEKSPCIVYRNEITELDVNGDIIILADDTVNVNDRDIPIELDSFIGSPLYIGKGDYYCEVLPTTERNLDYGSNTHYVNKEQYNIDSDLTIKLPSYFGGNNDSNLIANNLIQCRYNRRPNGFHLKNASDNYFGTIYQMNLYPTGMINVQSNNEFVGDIQQGKTWEKVISDNTTEYLSIIADDFGQNLTSSNNPENYTKKIIFEFSFDIPDFSTSSPIETDINMMTLSEWGEWTIDSDDFQTAAKTVFWYPESTYPNLFSLNEENNFNDISQLLTWSSGIVNFNNETGQTALLQNYYSSILYPPTATDLYGGDVWSPQGVSALYNNFDDIKKIGFESSYLDGLLFPRAGWEYMKMNIYRLFLRSTFDLNDIDKQEYYVDVKGRTHDSN